MAFEHIERLKTEYTDKYVVVDDSRPELLRFKGVTGTVRTVNMSGRALVEFDGGDNNIGWFDIDIDYLKVIDKPIEKPAPAKKAPAKPAAKKTDGGDKKPAAMSTADILAMARGGGAAKPAAEKKPAMSTEDILAAARGNASAAPAAEKKPAEKAEAKPDPSKMSVEDILAAARANKPSAAPTEEPAEEPAEEELVVEESAPEPEPEPTPAAPAEAKSVPTETPDILAYCRNVDGGS